MFSFTSHKPHKIGKLQIIREWADINNSMSSNFLQLNTSKTEIFRCLTDILGICLQM